MSSSRCEKERYNPFYGHCCTAHEIGHKAWVLSPDEAKAVARVQEFPPHRKVVFRILSLSNLAARLRFRLKKNEKTPVVGCGKRVFQGIPSMSDLSATIR